MNEPSMKASTDTLSSDSLTPSSRLRYLTVRLDQLKPNPGNPRRHSKAQVNELRRSYRAFGVINPLIVSPDLTILAGHGRYLAARAEKLGEIAVLVADGLTRAEMKAYALADNKLHDMSTTDMELVLAEIEAIRVEDEAFDITLTGFETAELDAAAGLGRTVAMNDLEDEPPPALAPEIPPVSRPGDLWQLGRHRLICGDARSSDIIDRLLAGRSAAAIISGVPADVPICGAASQPGEVVHGECATAADEMTGSHLAHFLTRAADAAKLHLKDGALILWLVDWRHVSETLEAGARSGFSLLNMLVWVKSVAGSGALWRSQHELICAFKHGTGTHVNNVQLGVHGRDRSNVLHYPGAKAADKGRKGALERSATVRPVALVADLMLDVTRRGDVVLDPFGDDGTAIVAAERTDRAAYLAEINPRFVDVAVRRWQALTGRSATLIGTDRSFTDVAAERLVSNHEDEAGIDGRG